MPNKFTDSEMREEFKKYIRDSDFKEFRSAKEFDDHVNNFWLSKFSDYKAYLKGEVEKMTLDNNYSAHWINGYQHAKSDILHLLN